MFRRAVTVLLGIALWASAVVGAVLAEAYWLWRPGVERGSFQTIEKHLVAKLRESTARGRLGSGVLLLAQGGRIAAEHGFGVASVAAGTPVSPERTLYLLASVSKAVTSWGVMKLVEEGRIGLDEPAIRYLRRWRFPGSEAYRERITVRHLLSHTAGLDDGLGYGGFGPGEPVQTLEGSLMLTRDSTVGAPRGVKVAWEPGTAMSYSGGGYTVLQLLVEEVTGLRFTDYMKDAVLAPLGMTRSSFDLGAIEAEGRLTDVATSYDASLRPHPTRRYTALAAVALYATARDLAQFARAYTGANPVLRPETLKAMMQPQAGTAGGWGLGQTLYAQNGAGGYVVGHDGGTLPASGALMRVNPQTGNAIVLMCSGGRPGMSSLAEDWVYWETGVVTEASRRQHVYDRMRPAAAAILLGTVAIAWWAWRSRKDPANAAVSPSPRARP